MRRRDLSKVLLASAAGSVVMASRAQAQTCDAPCYARTAAEISAGVTPFNFEYEPGNALRYGTNTTPGTTDMTAAINNALLSNRDVFIPAGTYLISDSLVYRDNMRIEGAGFLNTIIKADMAKSVFVSPYGETPSIGQRPTGVQFANFGLFSATAATITSGSIGINLRNAQYCAMTDVLMQYFDIGVVTNQIAQYLVFDHLVVQVANTGFYGESSGGGNRLANCDIGGRTVCLDLNGGAWDLQGVTLEALTSTTSYCLRAGRPSGASTVVHAVNVYVEGISTSTKTLQIEDSVNRSAIRLHRHSTLGPITNNAGETCIIEVPGQGYFTSVNRVQRVEFSPTIDGSPQSSLRSNGGNTLECRNSSNTGYADFYLRNLFFATGLGDYVDDSAAAAGGVAVGQIYRNGSVLKVRVS